MFWAVSVAAHHRGGPPQTFYEQYRGEFNARWTSRRTTPCRRTSTRASTARSAEPARPGDLRQGPARPGAAQHRLLDNLTVVRDPINRHGAPEGSNRLNSANIANLRAVFTSFGAPVTAPLFPAFLAASSQSCHPEPRGATGGGDRQRLGTHHQRQCHRRHTALGVRTAIATSAPHPRRRHLRSRSRSRPAPGRPGRRPAAIRRRDHDRRPRGTRSGQRAEEPVTLTPKSTVPNPGVTATTSFTVTPAARVRGTNTHRQPLGPPGTPRYAFTAPVTNTGTVAMTAHLDVTGLPAGLARRTPVPDAHFVVNDNRQPNFIASWSPAVLLNAGAGQAHFVPGASVRYRGGAQTFSSARCYPAARPTPA